MKLLALDPGSEKSTYVVLDVGGQKMPPVIACVEQPNLALLDDLTEKIGQSCADLVMAIETIEPMGLNSRPEVVQTAYWVGRFVQVFSDCRRENGLVEDIREITRRTVKLALCESVRATDASIRWRLQQLYGGPEAAKGTKKQPGPLHPVKGHGWQALAVGLTALRVAGDDR
jgi:hypothetical protein